MVNGQLTATYLRGANLIARNEEYYLFNAHGDVVNLTNASGAVTRSYAYDAFGNEKNPDENDANPFRYCGECWDSETGTYYLRARYYDPAIGRFTQQDTISYIYRKLPGERQLIDPLSLNLYTYCANAPILYCDLSGNFWETALDIAGLACSVSDFHDNPSLKNGAFLVWDIASIALPVVPGSYAGRAARILANADNISDAIKAVSQIDDFTDALKIVNKLDSSVDIVEFVKAGNRLVGSYRDMKKRTSGYQGVLQAHHLLEQRICQAMNLDINDMISVVLTKSQHERLTKLWRDALPYGINYNTFKKWEDVRDIAKQVYTNDQDLFELLDNYMTFVGK